MRALIVAAALLAAGPAFAQAPATSLTLADAAQAPARNVIIDGASWRCEGTACTASGGQNQPAARACRRVAQRLGPVTAFSWRGETLDAAAIAACNA